jgi:hypothetical protein
MLSWNIKIMKEFMKNLLLSTLGCFVAEYFMERKRNEEANALYED